MDNSNKNLDRFIKKMVEKNPQIPEDLDLSWENINEILQQESKDLSDILFDKLILEETSKLPIIDNDSDLDWESMNITIGKKQKLTLFKTRTILISIICMMLLTFGTCYHIKKGEKVAVSELPDHLDLPIGETKKLDLHTPKNINSTSQENAVLGSQDQNNNLASEGFNPINLSSKDHKANKLITSPQIALEYSDSKDRESAQDDRLDSSSNITNLVHTQIDHTKRDNALLITMNETSKPLIKSLELMPSISHVQILYNSSLPTIIFSQDHWNVANKSKKREIYLYATVGQTFGSHKTAPSSDITSTIGTDFGLRNSFGLIMPLSAKIKLNFGGSFTQLHSTLNESRMLSSELIQGTSIVRTECLTFFQNNHSNYIGIFAGLDYNLFSIGNFDVDLGTSVSTSKLVSHNINTLNVDNQLDRVTTPVREIGINLSIIPRLAIRYNFSPRIALQASLQSNVSLMNDYYILESSTVKTLQSINVGIGYHF